MYRILIASLLFLFPFSITFVRSAPLDYARIVAFGDSLSDNGNLHFSFQPLAAGYYNGRFSNGPTWIELLSDPNKSTNPNSTMNRFWGGANFAAPFDVGTPNNNVNAAVGGALTTGAPPIPSVADQIAAFSAAGGTFRATDLVSVQGGGNDVLAFLTANPTPTPTNSMNAGTTIAVNEATNIQSLVNAGAKTILVSNLPSAGTMPAFSGNPVQDAAAQLVAGTYNSVLAQRTRDLAAANPTVNFVEVRWDTLAGVIMSRPAAFGFSNVTGKCYSVGVTCAAPSTYFWWDDIHPSAAAHSYIATYAALLLSTSTTGKIVAALGDTSRSNRLARGDILLDASTDFAPLSIEISGSGNALNAGNFGYQAAGLSATARGNSGDWGYGGSLQYSRGTLSGNTLGGDVASLSLDGYGILRQSGYFIGLEGGVGFDQFSRLTRDTLFPTVFASSTTGAAAYSIAGAIGAQYRFGDITIVPAARVGAVGFQVSGFTESAELLALSYSDRVSHAAFARRICVLRCPCRSAPT